MASSCVIMASAPKEGEPRSEVDEGAVDDAPYEEMDVDEPFDSASSSSRPRGRPVASSKKQAADIPLNEKGVPYEIVNDELATEDDPAGDTKVDKNGVLLGIREYRVRTFTVMGRGDRLYMLSTEPARCMGFRDSYLLFQKHPKLWKIVVNDEEKYDLISRNIIPHSYKGRQIGVVTAHSLFKEFGARIVVGGHRVVDDYYEKLAINEGHSKDELADPEDKLPPAGEPYNRNQYVAWHGASAIYHHQPGIPGVPVVLAQPPASTTNANVTPQTVYSMQGFDPNWLYKHTRAVSDFNSSLARKRRAMRIYNEPHTAVSFAHHAMEPSEAHISRIKAEEKDEKRNQVIVDTVIYQKDRFVRTGLKNVDPAVYSDAPASIKSEIIAQIQRESQ